MKTHADEWHSLHRILTLICTLALLATSAIPGTGSAASLAAPPVRADHPRLFITSDTIADLRHRCQNVSPVSEVYQTTRTWVDGLSGPSGNQWVSPYELINILIVYVVENRDPTYLAQAKVWMDHFAGLGTGGDSWTHGIRLKALALGYDCSTPT